MNDQYYTADPQSESKPVPCAFYSYQFFSRNTRVIVFNAHFVRDVIIAIAVEENNRNFAPFNRLNWRIFF